MNDEELSVTLAAERAGVAPTTIRRAIRLGNLPARLIGSYYVLKASDIDSWKESEKHNPNMRRK